jgi:hypothetical protein
MQLCIGYTSNKHYHSELKPQKARYEQPSNAVPIAARNFMIKNIWCIPYFRIWKEK